MIELHLIINNLLENLKLKIYTQHGQSHINPDAPDAPQRGVWTLRWV